MIICTSDEREQKIFDLVQTLLGIKDEGDLKIFSVEPSYNGFEVLYGTYQYDEWSSSSLTLFNSQILLIESFKK